MTKEERLELIKEAKILLKFGFEKLSKCINFPELQEVREDSLLAIHSSKKIVQFLEKVLRETTDDLMTADIRTIDLSKKTDDI